jgi:O-antigen ligase
MGLLLLSEMGLIGFAVFCLAFSLILWRAWRAVKAAKAYPGTWRILPLCIGLLVAAIAGAVLYVARFGSYYYLNFYLTLALTSVIPEVLWQAEALSKNQRRAHA